jgi:shikimate kinase
MLTNSESIILMGIKHCGKSTQGKLLAQKLNYPFYDTDDIIFEQTNKTAREIFNEGGQEAFMQAEENACTFILQKRLPAVISTGGGICVNQKALDVLKQLGQFIFLEAEESICANRIVNKITQKLDGTFENIPAYIAKKNPHSISDIRIIFHDFYVERTSLYKQIADISFSVQNISKEENSEHLFSLLKQ